MDPLLIIIIVGMSILMLGLSIYLLIVYVHPDDKGWGTAIYCKVLVIFGMLLVWAQALMLPLDVANNHFYPGYGGINMQTLWGIVYISTLVMITILLPFAMIFYQTDEDDTWWKRLLTTLCYLSIALAAICILLFVSWAFLKYADVPVRTLSLGYNHASSGLSNNSTAMTLPSDGSYGTDTTMQIQSSFVVYSMAILSFFGWILLILFGGVGLFALPLDWIKDFRNRPKPRKSQQMIRVKKALAQAVEVLTKQCDQVRTLYDKQIKNNQEGFFQRMKTKRKFQTKLSELNGQFNALEDQVKLFKLEVQYEKGNPIIPWLKLFCAILFILTAVLWLLQLIFGYLAMKDQRPLIPFLNELFVYMENSNAGFIATFLYSYFILYLVWAVVKGNVKFGIRIPMIVRFYPMKPNQTWMNSFLFNIIMLLIASAGITQLATGCFPTYTRNTAIYNMFGLQVNYMRFYRYLYQNKVFGIALVVWIGITLIYMLVTCNKPSKYHQQMEELRKKINNSESEMVTGNAIRSD